MGKRASQAWSQGVVAVARLENMLENEIKNMLENEGMSAQEDSLKISSGKVPGKLGVKTRDGAETTG